MFEPATSNSLDQHSNHSTTGNRNEGLTNNSLGKLHAGPLFLSDDILLRDKLSTRMENDW